MLKKVLIVEDEPDTLRLLSERFKQSDFEVVTAVNGREGLNLLSREKIDLIVLDVEMPLLDGFGMLKIIKKDPKLSNIPIMISTAHGKMKDIFEVMGVDYFMAKPYDFKAIVEKANQLLVKKALLVSDFPYINEKIVNVLKRSSYETVVVKGSEEMEDRAKKTRFVVLIVHLANIKGKPAEFILDVKGFKCDSPKIFVYSDSNVLGLEEGDSTKIEKIKSEWNQAGINLFYDARLRSIKRLSSSSEALTFDGFIKSHL